MVSGQGQQANEQNNVQLSFNVDNQEYKVEIPEEVARYLQLQQVGQGQSSETTLAFHPVSPVVKDNIVVLPDAGVMIRKEQGKAVTPVNYQNSMTTQTQEIITQMLKENGNNIFVPASEVSMTDDFLKMRMSGEGLIEAGQQISGTIRLEQNILPGSNPVVSNTAQVEHIQQEQEIGSNPYVQHQAAKGAYQGAVNKGSVVYKPSDYHHPLLDSITPLITQKATTIAEIKNEELLKTEGMAQKVVLFDSGEEVVVPQLTTEAIQRGQQIGVAIEEALSNTVANAMVSVNTVKNTLQDTHFKKLFDELVKLSTNTEILNNQQLLEEYIQSKEVLTKYVDDYLNNALLYTQTVFADTVKYLTQLPINKNLLAGIEQANDTTQIYKKLFDNKGIKRVSTQENLLGKEIKALLKEYIKDLPEDTLLYKELTKLLKTPDEKVIYALVSSPAALGHIVNRLQLEIRYLAEKGGVLDTGRLGILTGISYQLQKKAHISSKIAVYHIQRLALYTRLVQFTLGDKAAMLFVASVITTRVALYSFIGTTKIILKTLKGTARLAGLEALLSYAKAPVIHDKNEIIQALYQHISKRTKLPAEVIKKLSLALKEYVSAYNVLQLGSLLASSDFTALSKMLDIAEYIGDTALRVGMRLMKVVTKNFISPYSEFVIKNSSRILNSKVMSVISKTATNVMNFMKIQRAVQKTMLQEQISAIPHRLQKKSQKRSPKALRKVSLKADAKLQKKIQQKMQKKVSPYDMSVRIAALNYYKKIAKEKGTGAALRAVIGDTIRAKVHYTVTRMVMQVFSGLASAIASIIAALLPTLLITLSAILVISLFLSFFPSFVYLWQASTYYHNAPPTFTDHTLDALTISYIQGAATVIEPNHSEEKGIYKCGVLGTAQMLAHKSLDIVKQLFSVDDEEINIERIYSLSTGIFTNKYLHSRLAPLLRHAGNKKEFSPDTRFYRKERITKDSMRVFKGIKEDLRKLYATCEPSFGVIPYSRGEVFENVDKLSRFLALLLFGMKGDTPLQEQAIRNGMIYHVDRYKGRIKKYAEKILTQGDTGMKKLTYQKFLNTFHTYNLKRVATIGPVKEEDNTSTRGTCVIHEKRRETSATAVANVSSHYYEAQPLASVKTVVLDPLLTINIADVIYRNFYDDNANKLIKMRDIFVNHVYINKQEGDNILVYGTLMTEYVKTEVFDDNEGKWKDIQQTQYADLQLYKNKQRNKIIYAVPLIMLPYDAGGTAGLITFNNKKLTKDMYKALLGAAQIGEVGEQVVKPLARLYSWLSYQGVSSIMLTESPFLHDTPINDNDWAQFAFYGNVYPPNPSKLDKLLDIETLKEGGPSWLASFFEDNDYSESYLARLHYGIVSPGTLLLLRDPQIMQRKAPFSLVTDKVFTTANTPLSYLLFTAAGIYQSYIEGTAALEGIGLTQSVDLKRNIAQRDKRSGKYTNKDLKRILHWWAPQELANINKTYNALAITRDLLNQAFVVNRKDLKYNLYSSPLVGGELAGSIETRPLLKELYDLQKIDKNKYPTTFIKNVYFRYFLMGMQLASTIERYNRTTSGLPALQRGKLISLIYSAPALFGIPLFPSHLLNARYMNLLDRQLIRYPYTNAFADIYDAIAKRAYAAGMLVAGSKWGTLPSAKVFMAFKDTQPLEIKKKYLFMLTKPQLGVYNTYKDVTTNKDITEENFPVDAIGSGTVALYSIPKRGQRVGACKEQNHIAIFTNYQPLVNNKKLAWRFVSEPRIDLLNSQDVCKYSTDLYKFLKEYYLPYRTKNNMSDLLADPREAEEAYYRGIITDIDKIYSSALYPIFKVLTTAQQVQSTVAVLHAQAKATLTNTCVASYMICSGNLIGDPTFYTCTYKKKWTYKGRYEKYQVAFSGRFFVPTHSVYRIHVSDGMIQLSVSPPSNINTFFAATLPFYPDTFFEGTYNNNAREQIVKQLQKWSGGKNIGKLQYLPQYVPHSRYRSAHKPGEEPTDMMPDWGIQQTTQTFKFYITVYEDRASKEQTGEGVATVISTRPPEELEARTSARVENVPYDITVTYYKFTPVEGDMQAQKLWEQLWGPLTPLMGNGTGGAVVKESLKWGSGIMAMAGVSTFLFSTRLSTYRSYYSYIVATGQYLKMLLNLSTQSIATNFAKFVLENSLEDVSKKIVTKYAELIYQQLNNQNYVKNKHFVMKDTYPDENEQIRPLNPVSSRFGGYNYANISRAFAVDKFTFTTPITNITKVGAGQVYLTYSLLPYAYNYTMWAEKGSLPSFTLTELDKLKPYGVRGDQLKMVYNSFALSKVKGNRANEKITVPVLLDTMLLKQILTNLKNTKQLTSEEKRRELERVKKQLDIFTKFVKYNKYAQNTVSNQDMLHRLLISEFGYLNMPKVLATFTTAAPYNPQILIPVKASPSSEFCKEGFPEIIPEFITFGQVDPSIDRDKYNIKKYSINVDGHTVHVYAYYSKQTYCFLVPYHRLFLDNLIYAQQQKDINASTVDIGDIEYALLSPLTLKGYNNTGYQPFSFGDTLGTLFITNDFTVSSLFRGWLAKRALYDPRARAVLYSAAYLPQVMRTIKKGTLLVDKYFLYKTLAAFMKNSGQILNAQEYQHDLQRFKNTWRRLAPQYMHALAWRVSFEYLTETLFLDFLAEISTAISFKVSSVTTPYIDFYRFITNTLTTNNTPSAYFSLLNQSNSWWEKTGEYKMQRILLSDGSLNSLYIIDFKEQPDLARYPVNWRKELIASLLSLDVVPQYINKQYSLFGIFNRLRTPIPFPFFTDMIIFSQVTRMFVWTSGHNSDKYYSIDPQYIPVSRGLSTITGVLGASDINDREAFKDMEQHYCELILDDKAKKVKKITNCEAQYFAQLAQHYGRSSDGLFTSPAFANYLFPLAYLVAPVTQINPARFDPHSFSSLSYVNYLTYLLRLYSKRSFRWSPAFVKSSVSDIYYNKAKENLSLLYESRTLLSQAEDFDKIIHSIHPDYNAFDLRERYKGKAWYQLGQESTRSNTIYFYRGPADYIFSLLSTLRNADVWKKAARVMHDYTKHFIQP